LPIKTPGVLLQKFSCTLKVHACTTTTQQKRLRNTLLQTHYALQTVANAGNRLRIQSDYFAIYRSDAHALY